MAARSRKRRQKKQSTNRRRAKKTSRLVGSLTGVLVLLLTVTGMFQLGVIGDLVFDLYEFFVGQTYPLLMIIVILYSISLIIYNKLARFRTRWVWGVMIFYVGLLILMHANLFTGLNQHSHYVNITINRLMDAFSKNDHNLPVGGGMLGAFVFTLADFLLSLTGAKALAWLMMAVGLIVFFNIPWHEVIVAVHQACLKAGHKLSVWYRSRSTQAKQARKNIKTDLSKKRTFKPANLPTSASQSLDISKDDDHDEPQINVAGQANQDLSDSQKPEQSATVATASPADQGDNSEPSFVDHDVNDSDYQLPPLSLLTKIGQTDQSADLNAVKTNTSKLEKTLESFGVDAKVVNVDLGPAVTKYELRPAVGVKVSRITHLADDLALALAARDIRIEAPIPGKSLIGIEVPNRKVATIGFRDMEEAAPSHPDKPLEVPLGRTVTGQVMEADLTKMPHLLIAGATGSGKSVAINVIITSILLKAKPHQVKMLMIDPKKVELSVYNGIPHLLSPVVSDPKKAARALGKVVAEMERRYELFAQFGIRNIDGYNKQVAEHPDDENVQPMPLILVIVDELSDLMMTVSKDVEDAIVRIAQMGRAAGIHMILATQRPSVDVITGLIKANVPSRIAFAVSSGVDSRTILGTNGAEKLLGRGDMLFQPIDQNKPTRVQGAFISDQDVENVVQFIKDESTSEYDENMVVSDEEISEADNEEETDELFDDALKFVVAEQKASTSMIQRRFRIGYNRAARIIDEMEQRGYISPAQGSKPRQVYKEPDNDSSDQ